MYGCIVVSDSLLTLAGSHAEAEQVLATVRAIPLTREKLGCLRDGEWLNEEVINAYLGQLQDSSRISGSHAGDLYKQFIVTSMSDLYKQFIVATMSDLCSDQLQCASCIAM
jgi:Ulp1 family protease